MTQTETADHHADSVNSLPVRFSSLFRMQGLGLKSRLIVLMLVILIPVLTLELKSHLNAYETKRKNEFTANLEVARAVARSFEAFVQDVHHQQLALGIALTSLPPLTTRDVRRLLEESLIDSAAVRDFSWISPKGIVLASSDRNRVGLNRSEEAYFQEIGFGRERVVSNLVWSKAMGDSMLVIARAIRDEAGTLLGLVAAEVKPELLDAVLSIERSRGGSISLVDANGMVVYNYPHVYPSWEGQDWKKAQNLLRIEFEGGEYLGLVVPPLAKRKRIMASTPVKSVGWVAKAGRVESEVMLPISWSLIRESGLFVAVALTFFLVSLGLSRSITNPIKRLQRDAMEFGRGKVDIRTQVRGPAEVQDLARVFNNMAEEIQVWIRRAERRAADAEEGERILNTLMAHVPEGIAIIDSHARIRKASKRWEEMIGSKASEGVPLQEYFEKPIVFRADGSTVVGHDDLPLAHALTTGKEMSNIELVLRGEGKPDTIFLCNAAPIKDSEGFTAGAICTWRDITALKKADLALRESEERFRFWLDATGTVFWTLGRDAAVVEPQPHFQACTGQTWEQCKGWGWLGAIHPADRERVVGLWKRAFEKGQTRYECEARVRSGKSGEYRWLLARGVAVLGPDGSVVQWVGAGIDIHGRKKAEEALRESEERFRGLADTVPDIIFTAQANGECDYLNERFYDLTGMPPGHGEGLGWVAALHPDDSERVKESWIKATGNGESWECKFRLCNASGYRWTIARSRPLFDSEGRISRILGVATDIDELIRVQEVLLKSKDAMREMRDELEIRVRTRTAELECRNQELQEFTFAASHDLQEPLRKIQTLGDLVMMKCRDSLSMENHDYIERMQRSAARMQGLLNSLQAYSRLTSKIEPFVEVDFAKVVEDVLSNLEIQILETEGKIEVGSLPSAESDYAQMAQLFQNLIGNALKFRKEGDAPRVKIYSRFVEHEQDHSGKHEIYVEDNGIGFEEKYLDLIFKPFESLHGKETYSGLGMGLAICKKIVERHNGAITARSAPGEGSTFIVTLPARQEEVVRT